MSKRVFWLAVPVALLLLGGYAAYLMCGHDWRGRFAPDELKLTADVAGVPPTLTVVLTNQSPRAFMIYDSPGLAPPFQIELAPVPGGRVLRRDAPLRGAVTGRPRILDSGGSYSWTASLADLFPPIGAGNYTLRVAYDPQAAARRDDPCATDLTLGRTEAPPVAVKF